MFYLGEVVCIYLSPKKTQNPRHYDSCTNFSWKKHQKTKTNLIAKSKPNPAASVAAK